MLAITFFTSLLYAADGRLILFRNIGRSGRVRQGFRVHEGGLEDNKFMEITKKQLGQWSFVMHNSHPCFNPNS